jgi:adenosylmethionine-8-amino-7-oxononanoate aminotransferase
VAAAALANLQIIEREGLVERVAALEDVLADALAPIGKHPLVGELRAGTGLLGAVQIDAEAQKEDPTRPGRVTLELRRAGVLSRVLAGGALQISPAFVVTEREIEQGASAIYEALEAVS